MTSRIDSVINIATLGIALVIFGFIAETRFRTPASPQRPSPVEQVHDLQTTLTSSDKREGHGGLVVVEFSDFQCPYCGIYARDTYAKLRREFVDTGKIQYVFRHFPLEALHPLAFKAAEASECALQQGHFWPMHDRLFASQAALADSDLRRHARELGLQDDLFSQCLDSDVSTRVRQDIAEGRRLGVSATPTLLIGSVRPDGRTIDVSLRLRGVGSFDALKAQLDRVLAKQTASVVTRGL
jgi:protein-disulfide isomerase